MSAAPEDHFPLDYYGGRDAFLGACDRRRIGVETWQHPTAKGPGGKALFVDVCSLGDPQAERGLLLISGTHGVEGYFGSGVQTGLLRGGISAPAGTRIVMIHALNPFGFAWNRRVNEDNVDLNRNFIDHESPPGNRGYDELAEAIALRDISAESFTSANAVLSAYLRKHGAPAWQQAISGGQYSHPDGLFFGGHQPCWSSQTLGDIAFQQLRQMKNLVAIDFHTGLGESGIGELIVDYLPASPAYRRAKAIWGDMVTSTSGGNSLSAPLTGTMDIGMERLLSGVDITFAALEVGTLRLEKMLHALRMANWQDRFATNDALAEEIAKLTRDAFYTDTAVWKRAVWHLAQRAIDGALNALENN